MVKIVGAGTESRTPISSLGRMHSSRYTIPASIYYYSISYGNLAELTLVVSLSFVGSLFVTDRNVFYDTIFFTDVFKTSFKLGEWDFD